MRWHEWLALAGILGFTVWMIFLLGGKWAAVFAAVIMVLGVVGGFLLDRT